MATIGIIKRLKAKLAEKQALLAKYKANLDTLLDENPKIESYKFESGDASQQVKYINFIKYQDGIERLEKEIERIYQQLEGGGMSTLRLSRRG